jgi:hypothetical protein
MYPKLLAKLWKSKMKSVSKPDGWARHIIDFDPNRSPKVLTGPIGAKKPLNIVTTDFFAFDTERNFYKLQGLGYAVEMGDAVLGLAIQELGSSAPRWAAIRNALDPQIPNVGTIQEQANL